jgi:hypothetical protein
LDLGLSHRELELTATTFLSNIPVNHRQYRWGQGRQSKLGFLNGVATLGHLTYLLNFSGTTTNIWLMPVQEDPSMTACLEHSASNL